MTATVGIDPRIKARRIEVMRSDGRRRRYWLVAVAVLVVLVGVAAGLTRSPVLDVDHVRIDGLDRTTADEALSAAGIGADTPIVWMDLEEARQAVAALPWVAEVWSEKEWPGTVRLRVTEREPAAVLPAGAGGWATVDAEGRVLEVTSSRPPGLTVVQGVTAGAPGTWVPTDAGPAIEVAAAIPPDLQSELTDVRVDPTYGVVAGLVDGGEVVWGDETGDEDKVVALRTMLERADLACLDQLDVSAPSAPVLTRAGDCL